MQKQLTEKQKQRDIDLWIIVMCSVVVLLFYSLNQDKIKTFTGDASVPILLRVLLSAAFQFGLAGLGISVIALIRKQFSCQRNRNADYGNRVGILRRI